MAFRLKVNDKLDDKLLQNFPKDPYSDITILTKSLALELSLAYLSIDSKFFADLPSDTNEIDLSHLNEQCTVYVLRALYGGDLQATSVADLEEIYRIVTFLQIDQFISSISANLRKLHESKKQNSPFNLLEVIQFCVKTGIQKNLFMQHQFQNRLKVLQSSKNYLQLGKLSDNTLNTLLIEFLAKQGDKGDSVVNHILQNYFNRKNYRPADYFSTTQLYPLRVVWEKYHHKVIVRGKLQKTTSIQELRETTPVPLHQRHSDSTQFKFGRLANLPAINTQSVNLASEFFQSPQMAEEDMLDHHIQTLSKQLEQKNKKIAALQLQLKDLQELKAKKSSKEIQASIDDINVFKNVWRPRKSKQQQPPKGDQSVSASEYAFQNIRKPIIQQEREGKAKVTTKTSINKKMFI